MHPKQGLGCDSALHSHLRPRMWPYFRCRELSDSSRFSGPTPASPLRLASPSCSSLLTAHLSQQHHIVDQALPP